MLPGPGFSLSFCHDGHGLGAPEELLQRSKVAPAQQCEAMYLRDAREGKVGHKPAQLFESLLVSIVNISYSRTSSRRQGQGQRGLVDSADLEPLERK